MKTYSPGGAKSIVVYDAAFNCLTWLVKKIKIIIVSLHCNKIG